MTKAHIIQQAAVVFNQQGYAGTSMSDIMRATGLKKGGIYNHFQSKEN
jgi:AcrR family transcriptional regulator